jgi:hypothetical protein
MYKHIKEMLQNGQVIHVEFTKKNGETRKMNCTTNLDLIPESEHPSEDRSNYIDEKVIRAYDLDVEGWRSFRVDSVNVLESKEL